MGACAMCVCAIERISKMSKMTLKRHKATNSNRIYVCTVHFQWHTKNSDSKLTHFFPSYSSKIYTQQHARTHTFIFFDKLIYIYMNTGCLQRIFKLYKLYSNYCLCLFYQSIELRIWCICVCISMESFAWNAQIRLVFMCACVCYDALRMTHAVL